MLPKDILNDLESGSRVAEHMKEYLSPKSPIDYQAVFNQLSSHMMQSIYRPIFDEAQFAQPKKRSSFARFLTGGI